MERGQLEYSPERDIPKAVEEIKSLSPSQIVVWIRDNRTEKDGLGKKHQKDLTPESVTMWLKRHDDVKKALERKLESELVTPEAISEDTLRNGMFEKLPCVEKWQLALRGRKAGETAITVFARILRQICKGEIPQSKKEKKEWKALHPEQPVKPREHIEAWGLKHPARLTLEDCLRYNSELTKRGLKGRAHRLTMRNFLKSRNVEGYDTISGELETSAGQYSHLYTPPEKIRQIFAWLKATNLEAHDCCYFAFKTACRITATLEAEAKYIDREESTIYVFEKSSLHKGKRKQKKFLSSDVMELLKPRIERGGKLFNIEETELNGLLRACYREIIPELADEIPMPTHFWRHQFAQHGLRATAWNYGLIARLGHWTVETLERYYGKMDEQTAFESAKKFLPAL